MSARREANALCEIIVVAMGRLRQMRKQRGAAACLWKNSTMRWMLTK